MTLDDLSKAWNELRNAALGQGLQPKVSKGLATHVGEEYVAWRDAYQNDQWPTDDMAASLTAGRWVDRYRELLQAVEAEGVRPGYTLPKNPIEQLEGALGTAAALAGLVLAIGLSVPFLAWAMRKGKAGR